MVVASVGSPALMSAMMIPSVMLVFEPFNQLDV